MFKPDWKMGLQKLTDGVYAWLTQGIIMKSNVGWIEGTDCALVFDSLSTLPMMKNFLDSVHMHSDKKPSYLVLSHAHGDHCLSASCVNAPVIIGHKYIQEQIAKNIAENRSVEKMNAWYPDMDYTGTHFVYPNLYMGDCLKIDLGGRTAELYYAGHCHTKEDIYLYLRDEGIVFCADLLFNHVVPSFHQGNIYGMIDGLTRLLSLDAERYVPGHGPIARKDDVRMVRDHYARMLELAQEGVRIGRSSEDSVYILEKDMGVMRTKWAEPERVFVSMDCIYAQVQGVPFHFKYDPAKLKRFSGSD